MVRLLDFEHDSAGNLIGVTVDYDGERIELERVRNGKWSSECEPIYKCSECKHSFHLFQRMNYCPNCGAKMNGKDTNVPTKAMDGGKQDAQY